MGKVEGRQSPCCCLWFAPHPTGVHVRITQEVGNLAEDLSLSAKLGCSVFLLLEPMLVA